MFKDEIKKIFKGDVEDDIKILNDYSHDYSIFEVKPELVVYPKDSEDVKNLIKYLNKKKDEGYSYLSVTARAAGTDMAGGPLNDSIIMDMTRYMNGVRNVKRGDFGKQRIPTAHEYSITGLATVLPGTFYRDFEKETLKQNLIMPCYPASKSICAVGGMVANNGAGEKTLKYGQNKDLVKFLKVVLDDGEEYLIEPLSRGQLEAKILENNRLAQIYQKVWALIKRNYEDIKEAKPKTTKNSSGYLLWDIWDAENQIFDPTKIFIGAQGTTGIITEITYKLIDTESASTLLVMFLKDLNQIPELTKSLLENDIETLEIYDDNTIKFAVKFFGSFLKEKGILGSIKYAWQFLPEFFMVLTGGMPKLIVLAEFVSNDLNGTLKEAMVAQNRIAHFHLKSRITKTPEERDKYFAIRRDSFKLLSDHSKGLRTAPFIDDIVIPVANLPKYLPELISILDEKKILYTIAGHLGDGNLHVIPLMDFKNPETDKLIVQLSDEVYPIVKKYGGSMTAEHNDGLVRTPYLELMFGKNITGIFKEFKEIVDPRNTFNPKKKVGATLEDLKKYIIRPEDISSAK
jgi:FAD/FMN-containing dehydrogenase